jgi:hypothetical protein
MRVTRKPTSRHLPRETGEVAAKPTEGASSAGEAPYFFPNRVPKKSPLFHAGRAGMSASSRAIW